MANPVVAMRSSPLKKEGMRRSALFTGFSSSIEYLCLVALSDLLSTQAGRRLDNLAKIPIMDKMREWRERFPGSKGIL